MLETHKSLLYKNKSVFNTIGLIIVIAINMLAVLLPINGKSTGQIADQYPNLFTPAGITFSIWSVIYLSLLAFIIYQLWLAFSGRRPEELKHFMTRMKGWWLISCLANSCWLLAWHYELLPLSMCLMLLLLFSLLIIHRNFNISRTPAHTHEKLFIQLPFSLYLGWISIATLANITALMVYYGWDGAGISQVNWAVLMIGIGTLLSLIMILRRNNITYALVSIWAFYGILLKREQADVMEESPVIHASIIAMGVIAVGISWQLYRRKTN
ncbi:hypothetical protein [Chitinophaga defluvii]|uniref:TspO/MBR related protein n=1 Tax=Chitinophaga defluvii TaxID=3163343 RepID=A0ABV2T2A2_9BACT